MTKSWSSGKNRKPKSQWPQWSQWKWTCPGWSRNMSKTAPVKFMEVSVETGSPRRCVTRSLLCFCWALFLVALPARAQTPPSDQKTIALEELQQMALQNNPTFAQGKANVQAAEGRKNQSGLYPNPTVGYQGEQIRGGSVHGGEKGFFLQQDVVLVVKPRLVRNNFC